MLRVFIADDEQPARKRLVKLLGETEGADRLEIVGEASDGMEAVEKLSDQDVDVLFLDIQMPGYDGFEVLDRLEPERRPVVVFTTAFDEYAIQAFEANAVDYLLKPIPADRLKTALDRAEKLVHMPESRGKVEEDLAKLLDWMDAQSVADATTDPSRDASVYLKQLSIPYRDRILIISIERLVSIEISEGITRVFIVDDDAEGPRVKLKQHIVNYTLDELGGLLDPETFIRVHRAAIANFNHIRELIPWFSGRYKLIMTGSHEVISSRERSKLLKERLRI